MKSVHDGETGRISIGIIFVREVSDGFTRHCLISFSYPDDLSRAHKNGFEKTCCGSMAHPRLEGVRVSATTKLLVINDACASASFAIMRRDALYDASLGLI